MVERGLEQEEEQYHTVRKSIESASSKKPQVENEKFAMRTYLNRIGLIGEEFANCRAHLTKPLSGSAAWRFRVG